MFDYREIGTFTTLNELSECLTKLTDEGCGDYSIGSYTNEDSVSVEKSDSKIYNVVILMRNGGVVHG